jgi:hypothetical protein
MNRRQLALLIVAGASLANARAEAEEPPTTWDGLVRVPSKKLKFVYLAPDADFRPYDKVMIDPTEIAFDKKWLQNYNSTVSFDARLTGSDVQSAITEGVKGASDIFDKAFADGGYPVVTAAAPDVLRVRTGVVNIQVAAPDVLTAGRVIANTDAAGAATFVIEVRDSQSNALMGRAVDARLAGDDGIILRNALTNRRDFRDLVKTWAKICVAGLNELKARSAAPA